jgi:hypothetical protein
VARRGLLTAFSSLFVLLGALSLASTAAAAPISLVLSQGSAFAILGHSCGGIQEKVYATGFGSNGYPTGDALLSTRCGGSGRGGGYKTTTYTASASVVWTWLGETRSAAPLAGPAEENGSFSAVDSHGDHLYNVGSAAFLETGEPPLQPPAAPTEVSAAIGLYEAGETEYLRMTVTWAVAPETAGLISSSTVTATPVHSSAPVLSATTSGSWATAELGPIAPNTIYRVTVTNTDAEGTSEPSAAVELKSPNSDGEGEKEQKNTETCERNSGLITLSPGLTETPTVQNVTVRGALKGCDGPYGFESGSYVDHLRTSEPVACPVLASASIEPITTPVSLRVTWLGGEGGVSKGTLTLPLSEVPLSGLSGTLMGGPFASPTSIEAASVYERFAGAASCGVPQGKRGVVQRVRLGAFSTSEVEFGQG